MKHRLFAVIALILSLALVAGCGASPSNTPAAQSQATGSTSGAIAPQGLTVTAGAVGGAWYLYGAAFNELWESNIPGLKTTLVAGTGNSNPYVVNNGEAQIGFTYVHSSADAAKGQGLSPEVAENIRLLMNIRSIFYFTCMIDSSLGIKSFNDILEKKPALICAVGASGSGSEEVFRTVFEAHGITYKDIESWGGRIEFIGAGSGADAFRDGHVNVLSNAAPQPFSTWVEVSASRSVNVLPIEESAAAVLQARGYDVATIDSKPYNDPTGEILSAGPTSIMVINKDVDEELVYQMTKLLYEDMDNQIAVQTSLSGWDPKNAANAMIPIHPGAERYYKEIGLIA